jgi:hypothetical protein
MTQKIRQAFSALNKHFTIQSSKKVLTNHRVCGKIRVFEGAGAPGGREAALARVISVPKNERRLSDP